MTATREAGLLRPLSDEHLDDDTFAGLLLLRIEGRVFFGNAQRIGEKMTPQIERAQPKVVVIDCGALRRTVTLTLQRGRR
jgi:sulfate permease, SulP family